MWATCYTLKLCQAGKGLKAIWETGNATYTVVAHFICQSSMTDWRKRYSGNI